MRGEAIKDSTFISPATLASMLDIGRSTASEKWPAWVDRYQIDMIRVCGRPRFRLTDIQQKLIPALRRGEA